MARGVEVGVGVIRLEPSAFDGKALGRKIGGQISDGVKASVRGTDLMPGGGKDFEAAGGKAAASFGSGFKTNFSKLAVGAGLFGGVIFAAGKQAFDAWSDLTESVNKAQVVFGDSFAKVDEQAKGAADHLLMSRQQALEAAGTFGNLFRAMGIGTDQAADMSTNLIQLAADLASFNNADPEDVLLALRSGLTGEVEPLRKFGVNLSDVRLKAEAMRLGLVKSNVSQTDLTDKTLKLDKATAAASKALKEHGESSIEYKDAANKQAKAEEDLQGITEKTPAVLDASQKANAAYSLIMQDTALAQGDVERTAGSAANQTKELTAKWEDFKAKIGEAIAPVGQTILEKLLGALDSLNSWWTEHGPGLIEWFHQTFGEDPGANFAAGLDIIEQKLDEVFGPDKMTSFKNGVRELFSIPPDADITDTLSQRFDEAKTQFQIGLNEIGQWFIDLLVKVNDFKDDAGVALGFFKSDVLDPIGGVLQTIWEWMGKIKDACVALGDGFQTALGWVKHDLLDPIFGTLQDIVGKVGELLNNDTFKAVAQALHIPGFDSGGVVPGRIGAPRLVVAHGGETILPTHQPALAALRGIGATPMPAAQAMSFGDINVTGVTQPWETAYAVRSELRKASYLAGGR